MVSCKSADNNADKNSVNGVVSDTSMSAKNGEPNLTGWPERPTLAVKEMTAKYGAPTEVGTETMVWYNAGPYKRIMVTKKEVPHNFPSPHMDFLEHTVSYNVPINKISDLIAYDASMTINKTQGEMSARCDLEGHNILTLNLARDIIMGSKTVQEARVAFGTNVVEDLLGKHQPYIDKLQFTPQTENVLFPDKPIIPGSPLRETAGTEGTDAEVLGFVFAVDINEILAAEQAETKKISQPVMDYARMLHIEHGANADKTLKLGKAINVTPSDTKAVDALNVKGAGELATLVPLDGKVFETAYLDAMIKGHTEVLAMIDNQLLKTAKNDVLKQYLTETRQHVAMHLDKAKSLKGSQ
jgi:predicted outer membrane protein